MHSFLIQLYMDFKPISQIRFMKAIKNKLLHSIYVFCPRLPNIKIKVLFYFFIYKIVLFIFFVSCQVQIKIYGNYLFMGSLQVLRFLICASKKKNKEKEKEFITIIFYL